jgi:hypothetical protein
LVQPEKESAKMSDHMERLGRMVDEAISQAGGTSELANAPTRDSRTPSGERRGQGVHGGGPLHQAVEDICWIYQGRYLAENLRRYGWREARRRVMRQGPLDREWRSHRGRPPVRLTRKGVEVKLADGVEALDWKRMQGQIRARRS